MRVFLTGANGWIGSAVARDLIEAGHGVVGLVRSARKGEALAAMGGVPLVGSLTDLDVLRRGAAEADGVIHTAFGLDMAKVVESAAEERQAIGTLGEVLAGSDRPLVVTGGVGVLAYGETFREDSPRPGIDPAFPRAAEQTAFALAARGVRVSVVRVPRAVHGLGERHGFVPMLAAIARRTGVSAYAGEGQNLWPSVHRLDAARVYRLVLERGGQDEAFHAVAEERVPFRLIAEAIGRQLRLPTRSQTPEEAQAQFGILARWVTGTGPASSRWTRATLDWRPREAGIIVDIDRRDYYA